MFHYSDIPRHARTKQASDRLAFDNTLVVTARQTVVARLVVAVRKNSRAAPGTRERARLRFKSQRTAFSSVTSQPTVSAQMNRVRRRTDRHHAGTTMNGHELAKNRSPFFDCVQCFFLEYEGMVVHKGNYGGSL